MGRVRRSNRGAVALAVVGCALASAPSAAAEGWLPPVALSAPQTHITTIPPCIPICLPSPGVVGNSVAVSATGTAVVAWVRRNDEGDAIVQASIRPPGGNFGTPEDVGEAAVVPFSPFGGGTKVAIDDAGTAILVYSATESGQPVAKAAVRPPGGDFGTPVTLSDPAVAVAVGSPTVAMGRDGHAVAVWARQLSSPNFAVESVARPPGGDFGPVTVVSGPGVQTYSPDVAVGLGGQTAVVWGSGAAGVVIQARVRPAGGSFADIRDLLSSGFVIAHDVVVDAHGRSTVVWSASGPPMPPDPPPPAAVSARSLTAAGGLGPGVQTLSDPERTGTIPKIALGSGDTAVVAWSDCVTGFTDCAVQAASAPPGGTFGAPQQISSVDAAGYVALAGSPGGAVTAAWTDLDLRLHAARRPPSGQFGPPADVMSPTPGWATSPDVGMDEAGSAVLAWVFTQTEAEPPVDQVEAAVYEVPAPSAGAPPRVDPPEAKPPRVSGKLQRKFHVRRGRTRIVKLRLIRLPAGGSKVRVSCRGKRCPFKSKSLRAKGRKLNVLAKLKPRQRQLRAGQTLELRVSKAGHTGRVFRFKIRKGKQPRLTTLCLPPGAKRPGRC